MTQSGQTMHDWLTRYLEHLKEEERSPHTLEKYRHDILAFLNSRSDPAKPIHKEDVIQFKTVRLKTHSVATVNSMLVAINGFLSFCGLANCRTKLLRQQRRLFREQARELTRAEYLRLIETAERQERYRLSLLIQAICATGIRVSEIRYLTVEAAQAGKAEISLKGKIRTILIPGKLTRKLLKYARKQGIARGEIFLTRTGNSLSRKQIWAEMKSLCSSAGVEQSKVFPHNLRHLFARCFYHVCRDIAKLADVLGHSNIETTRIYLISSENEHANILKRLQLIRTE